MCLIMFFPKSVCGRILLFIGWLLFSFSFIVWGQQIKFTRTKAFIIASPLLDKNPNLKGIHRTGGFYEKDEVANITNDMYVKESVYNVAETVARIKEILEKKGIPLFATFDHKKNAEKVKLDLGEAYVLVFGAPEVGTKLMQLNPAIAIELPLRVLVWQDNKGHIWVGCKDMRALARKYDIESPVVEKIQATLEQLVLQAASWVKKP